MVALAALLVLAGCTATPTQPTPSSPPPDAGFTADLSAGRDELSITYRFENRSSADLVVLNQIPAPPAAADPNAVSIIGVDPPGRVQIAKRAFAKPADLDLAQAPTIGGVIVTPGGSVSERVQVNLPLRRQAPFDVGTGPPLPDPITEVVFCVGVLRLGDAPVATNDGHLVTLGETDATVAAQHQFCSDPYPMT
jgi:hypothetical protein